MKYTRTYNHSNRREFANVTFEDGSTVSYEISTSRYNGVTLRQCGGRVPCGMRMVFEKNNVEFEEIVIVEMTSDKFFNHDTFGKCEVVEVVGKFTRIKILETSEVKDLFTDILATHVMA